MPPARTPAQIEAARRNGARSRGPATPEGKARSSMNALKHGLAAAEHLVLDGEDRAAYDERLRDLVTEFEPATAIEGHLVRRLAATLWKQDRADRLEAAVLAGPSHDLAYAPDGSLAVHAAASLNLARFSALRSYQAQLGREASRCLRELRLLRRERAGSADEPESGDGPLFLSPPAVSGGPTGPGGPTVEAYPGLVDAPVEPGHDEVRRRPESQNEPEGRPAAHSAARPAAANANANVPNEPGPRHVPAVTDSDAKRTRRAEEDPFKSVPWPAAVGRRRRAG